MIFLTQERKKEVVDTLDSRYSSPIFTQRHFHILVCYSLTHLSEYYNNQTRL